MKVQQRVTSQWLTRWVRPVQHSFEKHWIGLPGQRRFSLKRWWQHILGLQNYTWTKHAVIEFNLNFSVSQQSQTGGQQLKLGWKWVILPDNSKSTAEYLTLWWIPSDLHELKCWKKDTPQQKFENHINPYGKLWLQVIGTEVGSVSSLTL